jgi:hypothetical protein
VRDSLNARHEMLLIDGGRLFSGVLEAFVWTPDAKLKAVFREGRTKRSYSLSMDYQNGVPVIETYRGLMLVCDCVRPDCARCVGVACASLKAAA